MAVVRKKTMRQLYEQNRDNSEDDEFFGEYPMVSKKKLNCPEFPEDLTKVSYIKLGKLFSRYTSFMSFLNEEIAREKFFVAKYKIMKQRLRAEIVLSSRGIKMQKLAAAHRDPMYRELTKQLLHCTTVLNSFTSMLWTLKDFIKAIEYETTRRAQGYRANVED